jgi:hypothetical protein
MSDTTGSGFMATLTAKNPFGETVLGLVILTVTITLFFTAEGLYTATQAIGSKFQNLMDYTTTSDDKALVIHQDAQKYP